MTILLQLVWQAREAGVMCALFIISSRHKKEYIENLFKLVLILYCYVDIVSFYGVVGSNQHMNVIGQSQLLKANIHVINQHLQALENVCKQVTPIN